MHALPIQPLLQRLTAAVLAYPASWQMRMTGIGLGFVAIQAVNVLRIIVLFYLAGQSEAVDLEPGYQAVRAAHGNVLDDARQRLFLFLCGWLGGPQHYVERFGHPHLRRRHMPLKIGLVERDQWLACMDQAMGEIAVPEALRSHLREAFFKTADSMCNQSEIERL